MDWTPVSSPPSPAAEGHVIRIRDTHQHGTEMAKTDRNGFKNRGKPSLSSSYLPGLLQHGSTRILGVSLEPGLGPRGVDTLGQPPPDVTSLQPAKLSEILKIRK